MENFGKAGLVFTFKADGATAKPLRLYTDLTKDEAKKLGGAKKCRDLFGNPLEIGRWLPGTLIYENTL